MIPKFVVILIGCIFGSIAGIIPSNLIMFYGFTSETFGMSIPFIVVGIVAVSYTHLTLPTSDLV